MQDHFVLFPDQASTGAVGTDWLMFFLTGISATVGLLIALTVLYFLIRYRRRGPGDRTPRIQGSTALELSWTFIPLGIFLVMFAWGLSLYFHIVRPPDDALQVYCVAKQWMWKFQHPEGQREIDELHVPVGRPVKVTLTSQDVIHSFYVPAFRLKVDVLPHRYVNTWFEATRPGMYRLYCSEYCGTGHSQMTGVVVVMRPEDYQRWLATGAEGSLALEGRKLFLKYQCVSCHSADSQARAPVLEEIYGTTVPLADGGRVRVDETYLRESILEPKAKVAAGFRPIMPTFEGQVGEEDVIALIEFIKGLDLGETPPRVDSATPPEAPEESEQR